MKSLSCIILFIALPAAVFAASAESVVERLIAAAWSPQPVRVEWSFAGKVPAVITEHEDWRIAEPMPRRLAGSMLLTIESGKTRLTVSGHARVLATVLTVDRAIGAGQTITKEDLTAAEVDLATLTAPLLDGECLATPQRAARALVPGRALTERDLKPLPLVLRGQNVDVLLVEGSVNVRLQGRAMEEGAIGEEIAVAVEVGKTRRLKGKVTEDGDVLLTQ